MLHSVNFTLKGYYTRKHFKSLGSFLPGGFQYCTGEGKCGLSVRFTIVCLKNQDRKTETCLVSYSFGSFSFFYMGVGFK